MTSFGVTEPDAGLDTTNLVGHLAAWNYFMSVENDANAEFIKKWKAFIKDDKRVTNDPMEAHYIGFNMWVKAVEKAKSTDPDKVIDAIVGVEVPNPVRDDVRLGSLIGSPVYERNPGYLPIFLGMDVAEVSAAGWTVRLADGREFIDCVGGVGSLNFGHRHPRIVAAVKVGTALISEKLQLPQSTVSRNLNALVAWEVNTFNTCHRIYSLSLSLFMFRVFTNNSNRTISFNYFTMFTHFFYRCPNFHNCSVIYTYM